MSKLQELFEKLDRSLGNAKEEAKEFEGGKKAASLRLRKEAQASKVIWQEIRVVTMEMLKAMPTKTKVKK